MDFYKNNFKELKVKSGSKEDKYILFISFNSPDNMNAISYDMIDSLVSVFNYAERDENIRVIVLSGEGKSFCAGGDVKAMYQKTGMFSGDAYQLRQKYLFGIQRVPKTIEAMATPIIAMVNGAAVGAGCDIAAMCDIRIGSNRARFGETFCKIGLVPGDGGTWFLRRVVGYAKAMEMFLSGDIYDADAALQMGLLNKITNPEELLTETRKMAQKIAKNAPIAIKMTKKALKFASNDLDSQLDLLATYQSIAQSSEDHMEGLRALLEKDQPNFSGK